MRRVIVPPPASAQRLIDAPRADWLSAAEAAAWLAIGLRTFRELLASGELPRPVTLGRRKAQRWYWLDLVAWGHLRSIGRERADVAGSGTGTRRRAEGG
ncbi:MAG TPA: hypothetical protein VH682_03365 [Gemmataceae bacterium]|jgi:excisionase family DNA binding protein